MKRFTVAVVALSGCIVGPACQAIVGIEDRTEAPRDFANGDGAADVSTADAATDGCATNDTNCTDPDAAPPLGCPTGCLPPAPAGWIGPSATYDGAESGKPTVCPAGYTQTELEVGYQNMTAPAATCECGAPTITGRMCTAGVSTGCNVGMNVKMGTANTTTCFTTNAAGGDGWMVSQPTLVPGTCTYPNAKTTVEPRSFAKVNVSCGLPQITACAQRADCVATPTPEQPYGKLCVHKDGEHACPSADYAKRFVSFKKVEDTRACTTCAATPTGGACGGTTWFTRVKAADCGDTLAPKGSDMTAGTCYASYPGAGTLVDMYKMGPTAATCTATGGAPSGTASLSEPVTFCCNQ